jgi:hypothetical protein
MSVEVQETGLTRASLLAKMSLDSQKRAEIEAADIVVAPEFDFRGHKGQAFMPDTVAFYKFARAEFAGTKIAIAEQPGKERRIDLRSTDIWLPTLIVEGILLPLLVNVIWEFLKRRKLERESGRLHLAVMVEDERRGRAKGLLYEGPSDAFVDAFGKIDLKELFK